MSPKTERLILRRLVKRQRRGLNLPSSGLNCSRSLEDMTLNVNLRWISWNGVGRWVEQSGPVQAMHWFSKFEMAVVRLAFSSGYIFASKVWRGGVGT